MTVEVCEVCGTFIRPAALSAPLCPTCYHLARTPEPCQCGHDTTEHFPNHCAHSYWNAQAGTRLECLCTGFQEAS